MAPNAATVWAELNTSVNLRQAVETAGAKNDWQVDELFVNDHSRNRS